jgi:hypothetical protein
MGPRRGLKKLRDFKRGLMAGRKYSPRLENELAKKLTPYV